MIAPRITLAFACCAIAQFTAPAEAEQIANPVGLFSSLDKITAVTSSIEARIGEEVSVGSLKMKVFACYTRPITEKPDTAAFVQIYRDNSDAARETLFSGWMFAENPGLNALENPVYDVWLTGCRDPQAPPPIVEAPPPQKTPEAAEDVPED